MKTKTDHLRASSIEEYVMGFLAFDEAALVESHISECVSCANRVMQEAAFDVALTHVATRTEVRAQKRNAFLQRSSSALVGALAMAAAAFLFVVARSHADETPQNTPVFESQTYVETDAAAASAELDLSSTDAAMKLGRD